MWKIKDEYLSVQKRVHVPYTLTKDSSIIQSEVQYEKVIGHSVILVKIV